MAAGRAAAAARGRRAIRVTGEKFVEPWLERGIGPRPHFFEVDFGLPPADAPGEEAEAAYPPLVIRDEAVEVRISGRIDRVDLAELPDGEVGFWIIDYKTGRSSHYTSTDLAEFRRLQLTLYALAVQEVLLAGQPARPLGLAYWLVAEAGPKVVLPSRNQLLWLDETQRWRAVREQLQALGRDPGAQHPQRRLSACSRAASTAPRPAISARFAGSRRPGRCKRNGRCHCRWLARRRTRARMGTPGGGDNSSRVQIMGIQPE